MKVNFIFGRRPAARQVQANHLSFCFVLIVLISLICISPCDTSCNRHVSSSLVATRNATVRDVGAKPSNSEAVQNMSSAGCLGHSRCCYTFSCPCTMGFLLLLLLNTRIVSWPFATGNISVDISATTTVPPRGVSVSQVEISATRRHFHS